MAKAVKPIIPDISKRLFAIGCASCALPFLIAFVIIAVAILYILIRGLA